MFSFPVSNVRLKNKTLSVVPLIDHYYYYYSSKGVILNSQYADTLLSDFNLTGKIVDRYHKFQESCGSVTSGFVWEKGHPVLTRKAPD